MANITTSNDYNIADIPLVQGIADTKLTEFITKYEKIILVKLFGYTLYKLYKTVDPPTEAKYTNLLNGCDYTDSSGNTQEWKGLKSVLVGLITFYYLRWAETQTSQQGELQAVFDNAVKVETRFKMTQAWNEGIENALVCLDFMEVNSSSYPDLDCEYDYFQYLLNL